MIGGPEAFFLGQLWWRTDINMKIRRNLTLYTSLGIDIYNNFDEFNNPSSSKIPHVRSDIQEYLSEGQNNIARFKLEYMWSPYKDIYARFDYLKFLIIILILLLNFVYNLIYKESLYINLLNKFFSNNS